MALSISPARPEPPMPATTIARGLASAVKADRSVSAHDRSAVRTWAAAEATCRSMSPGSAASITSGVSSRSAARTNSAPPQPSRSSLMPHPPLLCTGGSRPPFPLALPSSFARAPGLLHQQHRDVVAHRVGQAAGGAGAHQLAGLLVDPQRRVALGAGQDVKQPAVDLH